MLPLRSDNLVIQLLIAGLFWLLLLVVVLVAVAFTFMVGGIDRADVRDMVVLTLILLTLGGAGALTTWSLSLAFSSVAGLGLAGLAVTIVLTGVVIPLVETTRPANWAMARTILGGFVGAAFVAAVDAGLKLLGA
jgi:hypothetical protein